MKLQIKGIFCVFWSAAVRGSFGPYVTYRTPDQSRMRLQVFVPTEARVCQETHSLVLSLVVPLLRQSNPQNTQSPATGVIAFAIKCWFKNWMSLLWKKPRCFRLHSPTAELPAVDDSQQVSSLKQQQEHQCRKRSVKCCGQDSRKTNISYLK